MTDLNVPPFNLQPQLMINEELWGALNSLGV